VELLEEYNH